MVYDTAVGSASLRIAANSGQPISQMGSIASIMPPVAHVWFGMILLQKSAILVVGLPLRPLEADSDYSFSHWTLVGV